MARYRSHLAGEYRDRRPREAEEGVPIRDMDLTPSKVWQTEPPQAVRFPGLVRSVLDVEEILRELTRKSLMELTANTVGPLGGFSSPAQRDRAWLLRQVEEMKSEQRLTDLFSQEWKQDEPRRPARINRFV